MKFDFFDGLNPQEIELVKARSKSVNFKKGAILFYEGDICEEILYLEKGKIKLLVAANEASQIPLYDFCEGEQCIVNIASALSHSKAMATAEAMTDIKGLLIPASVIRELIATSSAYQAKIFSLFTLRYASLTTLIEDAKFKRLDSRILEFLRSFNTAEIRVTNKEIAEHLGTSQNVINRVLQDLKNKNLLKLARGKITLLK
ncbi:Crp/Fnr family transcriptional regulator [Campylobacter curvus]|uniref:Crp/Fnr family transcriptional regulator n=1 Tax=Campylobacter curvus TaxID=200 RepID=UPI00037616ED|nr:Crp/Fnr family transcriptional regulator [Campylobacter curvus]QKF61975.1 transcriptional regulator, Crp/Fnr family [Campylobacter curvus]UEB50265.1 Crp/Fnr family transcriptional regulator [Campylobacter curvus]